MRWISCAAVGTSLLTVSNAYGAMKNRVDSTLYNVLPPKEDPWYTAPPNFEAAAPGAVLRVRAAPGNLTALTTNSSASYNILYRTTDSHYNPTWAVTTLFLPKSPTEQSNTSQPDALLSYQIPYDSADLNQSPSYTLYANQVSDIEMALGQGWYVNVPDFEGPLASFTAGVMSGHATIDSIRAVLNSGFGLSDQTKYVMWGYSGGALASELAAELQVQYAPEMQFAGAALGGLTPNVTSVMLSVNEALAAGLIPEGIVGLSTQWPELKSLLKGQVKTSGPYNASTFFNVTNQTFDEAIVTFVDKNLIDYFKDGLGIFYNPAAQKATNRDGMMGYHGTPQMPIFAYKAIHDEVSPVADTDALVSKYCEVGASIWYQRNTLGNHEEEASYGDLAAFEWLTAIRAGYVQTGCKVENVTYNGTTT